MTFAEHSQLQNIFQYFENLQSEEIEQAFLMHWKPFVQSLATEDDRALAFKLFYEWQITRFDSLLDFLQDEHPQAAPA